MKYNSVVHIGNKEVSITSPVYFIADIASNHDGDIERAKDLIWTAKEAGADAVKFQHFLAKDIVSDYGFSHMHASSHQAAWKKSVYQVYEECEYKREWNEILAKEAERASIDFMTTPYDYAAVDGVDCYVPAYKIGSGDITWTQFIEYVAKKDKPVLLATGAANIEDVIRAVECVIENNKDIVLMQCNTNYTGSLDNLKYVNLNVLKFYANLYPGMVLGLSDHTPGHTTVLGAIALGARVIEKHFTDDNNRVGPDHAFSMNPITWKDMVGCSRELEFALGDGYKKVEENENDTVIVQQRAIRLKHDMNVGDIISENDVEFLRPAPAGAYKPYQLQSILGKKLNKAKNAGEAVMLND